MTSIEPIIEDFDFNENTSKQITEHGSFYNDWPVVYILNSDKEMYIGETYHAPTRMAQHYEREDRRRLNQAHIIASDQFTKSSTLDIESSLIELCTLDNATNKKYSIQNDSRGLVNHNYHNKADFRKDSHFFQSLWSQLYNRKLVQGNVESILNSDIFKYSPYKALNPEQCVARDEVLNEILKAFKENRKEAIFINGSAGTGKTILAIYLLKLLATDGAIVTTEEESDTMPFLDDLKAIKAERPNLKVAYVVAMYSLRKTLQQVFKSIKGLKVNMVIGPNELKDNKYDVLIVDEAHRLKQPRALGAEVGSFYKASETMGFDKTASQLDWIKKQSDIQILFYDANQTVKPCDIENETFEALKNEQGNCYINLSSQMRCMGGNDYIKYINQILNCKQEERKTFDSYDLKLFDSISEMCDLIVKKEKEYSLSRIVAGYAFEWVSKRDKSLYDIQIQDKRMQWNIKETGWPNSIKGERVGDEVGCIHTIQGYDLNYCGVIFGPEIKYRNGKITIDKKAFKDKAVKKTVKDIEELKKYIINAYSVLMTRGIHGTYIYVCDKELREYLRNFF